MSDYFPTGETALIIVPPPDICAYADHYRSLYMPGQVEQIEPHITVTYPFVPTQRLSEIEPHLRGVLAKCAPFYLSLRGFEVFSGDNVLYLKIAHGEHVLALYKAILSEFPDYPAYGGQHADDFVPHMTVGVFEDRQEMERVHEELSVQRLFIGWDVGAVVVKCKMSDGIWDTWQEIPLSG